MGPGHGAVSRTWSAGTSAAWVAVDTTITGATFRSTFAAIYEAYEVWRNIYGANIDARPRASSKSVGPVATSSLAGAMPAADKAKLDTATSSDTASALVSRNSSKNAYANNWYATSDRRKKAEIRRLKESLAKVRALRGVSFRWREDKTRSRQLGLIAQEVREVVPEVVSEDNGKLAVSYGPITALLIEAIKEIAKRVERLERER